MDRPRLSIPVLIGLRWRRAALLADLSRDGRHALRIVRQHPGFTAAAVVTMALGAGITTAVASIVEAVLIRPLPYAHEDRIVVIQEWDTRLAGSGSRVAWADYLELAERTTSFEAIAGFDGASRTLTGAGAAERLPAVEVTPRFFEVLGVSPAIGRAFTSDDAAGANRVVILSNGLWVRVFSGDPAVVGRTVTLSGAPHTVIGVLPANFTFPLRAGVELWLPLRPSRAQQDRLDFHWLDLIALRRPDVSVTRAHEELRAVGAGWTARDRWHAAAGLRARPLRDDMVAGVRPALLVLAGAAMLLLLVAAANVSGLILSRAAGRAREFELRVALGATRLRLFRQLAVESACLAVAGSVCGLLLARWAIASFGATVPAGFRMRMPYGDAIAISPGAAALTLAFSCAAVAIASAAPAWTRGGGAWMAAAAGARSTEARSSTRFRALLVAAQIALAVVLLAGATLVARSVLKLTQVSPGFDMRELLVGRVSLPGTRYATPDAVAAAIDRILERMRAVPGVTAAEAIDQVALTGSGSSSIFTVMGRPDAAATPATALVRSVTPGYFAAMGIPLTDGRAFARSDTAGSPRAVVVNRAFVRRYFPDDRPIGQRLVFHSVEGRPVWTIVGVAGDEQFNDLDRPMIPAAYFPFSQSPANSPVLVVRTPLPFAQVRDPLRAAVASIDPELPLYGMRMLDQMAAESTPVFLRSLVMRMLAWFSIAALILGGVGVYGAQSQSMAARTREIGIRMALGATRGGIVRLVMRAGAAPAVAGLAAGGALTMAAAPALRSLLFGVTLLDIPSLATVLVLLAVVTLAACAIPAWRAVRTPVTTALRAE